MTEKDDILRDECAECGSCAELIHEAVASEQGVAGVELDVLRGAVRLDYDGKRLSDGSAVELVNRIALPLGGRHKACSMRISRRGGRACESCAVALERRLQSLPGVRQASVSFRGGILKLVYDESIVSTDHLYREIRGMGIEPVAVSPVPSEAEEPLRSRLWTRLSAIPPEVYLTAAAFVTMLAGFVAERAGGQALTSTVFYVISYVTGGVFGLKASLESLKHGTVDIDLLMILAALGAAVVGAPFEGAMLLFLFSLSNALQDYALGRTRNAIKELMKLRPDTALVRKNGELVQVPIDAVQVGDTFVLRPGDRIPLDGTVLTGESAVDQSSVTGESMPVSKAPGDGVFAGTINQQGALEVQVTRPASDSTIARLVRMVEEAQSEKAETQRFIDTAEQRYALAVIVLTFVAIVFPQLFLKESFETAFYRAMTLMVAASPCALVISTPATILSAIGNGARRGILFKGGAYVEQAATVKAIAFDKTGTLTYGKPVVTDVKLIGSSARVPSEGVLLGLAASVQSHSEHALAGATVEAARSRGIEFGEASGFQSVTGKGVRASVGDVEVHIGNVRYYEEVGPDVVGCVEREVRVLEDEAKTSVIVAIRESVEDALQPVGLIAFADVLRPDVKEVVAELKRHGVEHVVMLTGDNRRVAAQISARAGIDEYYAELLPEDKLRILRELRERYGTVAMVGDGVNDAPALAAASLGIAMGAAGTDVALETADVVLMADDLKKIPYLISLSHRTRRTLVANLGFALAMIIVMIVAILTRGIPLPLAVIGHEGSTVLVSLNGLRLLGYRQPR